MLRAHTRIKVAACRAGAMFALVCIIAFGGVHPATAENLSQVLYRFENRALTLGRYGAVAVFQERLFTQAANCAGKSASSYGAPDGVVGAKTRQAIIDLQPCLNSAVRSAVGAESYGAITIGLWRLLMPAQLPPPDAITRANHLTFALEGTDYDVIQFNFCQSRNPRSGKTFLEGDPYCHTNDPRAYLTWGPRGATAGAGAEIQQILFAAERANPGLLQKVFGPFTEDMHRLALGNNDAAFDILCAIWVDERKRTAFEKRFAAYGARYEVQAAYHRVYDAANADGGKIARFFKLYSAVKPVINRDPTEIDLAFFIDRATHGSVPPGDISDLVDRMTKFVTRTRNVPSAGELRKQLAAWLPTHHKYNDRLARDAIFLMDAPDVVVSDAHRRMWLQRSGLKASDFGLSDARYVSSYPVASPTGYERIEKFYTVLPEDARACPDTVRRARKK
ncbi:hypothetical protein [Thalassospira tepidiphila]|uniref:Uncharacterized protein n=2 Tax=Thalassospira tepidiphila TaxID=393657 RepID=A0A853L2C8_9PROT|nr:hypothetical protein [Thalassospira tepidiphila]NJB75039.1 hypothetical protein [Thalassospira tepidiphila]OAZ10431.1 hypothetical protein TH4_09385 [Thalassospira tepidiphila MCCC 1A03514]